jgi:hypothetical protein
VEMGAGHAARGADTADQDSPPNLLALLGVNFGKMPVVGVVGIRAGDDDQVSVTARNPGEDHLAARRRVNGIAIFGLQIHPVMVPDFTRDGIGAKAERRVYFSPPSQGVTENTPLAEVILPFFDHEKRFDAWNKKNIAFLQTFPPGEAVFHLDGFRVRAESLGDFGRVIPFLGGIEDAFAREEVQGLFDFGFEGHGGIGPDEGININAVVFGDGPIVFAHGDGMDHDLDGFGPKLGEVELVAGLGFGDGTADFAGGDGLGKDRHRRGDENIFT